MIEDAPLLPAWITCGREVIFDHRNAFRFGRLPLKCRVVEVNPYRMHDVALMHPNWKEPVWAMHQKLRPA
jgi:hypothetical protein